MEDRTVEVLAEAATYVREQLAHDASGHDWWHVERVVALARRIAGEEGADPYICELAALLHDVADYKIAGDEETGLMRVSGWLEAHRVDAGVTGQVLEIIGSMSFAQSRGKGGPGCRSSRRHRCDRDRSGIRLWRLAWPLHVRPQSGPNRLCR